MEPGVKAVREKERRQANNARERYLLNRNTSYILVKYYYCLVAAAPGQHFPSKRTRSTDRLKEHHFVPL